MCFDKVYLKFPISKNLTQAIHIATRTVHIYFIWGQNQMEIGRWFMLESTRLTLTREQKRVSQAGTKCPIQENSKLSKQKTHTHSSVMWGLGASLPRMQHPGKQITFRGENN